MPNKKIEFYPFSQKTSLGGVPPQPAIKYVPDWYKKIKKYHESDKMLFPVGGPANVTVKRCVPFLDAMTNGYMFVLDDDIIVQTEDGYPTFRWKSDDVMVTFHSSDQFEGIAIPPEYHNIVAKWHNEWHIKVPDGYSIYFTHPSNRFDLPFQVISGVVDCDSYIMPVHFPFLLRKDFEGIIEAGTPLCQMVLIKREKWKSETKDFDPDSSYKKFRQFTRNLVGSYKKNFWHRKEYE